MDRGACWAAVHGVAKSRTQLTDLTFTFHFHALEKEMATPSSVLAWRIPGTGEPGGLPSMGSHRVGHDLSYLAAAASKSGRGHPPELRTYQDFPASGTISCCAWKPAVLRVRGCGWSALCLKKSQLTNSIRADDEVQGACIQDSRKNTGAYFFFSAL